MAPAGLWPSEATLHVATSAKSKEEQQQAETSKDRDARMTFTAHLGELRTRMIRSLAAVFVGFIVCYVFSDKLIEALRYPLKSPAAIESVADPLQGGEPEGESRPKSEEQLWVTLSPLEPILVKLKIAAFGGLFFAFPYVLYQVCTFIFPGLKARERRAVKFLLVGCTTLAILGSAVAYWGILRMVLPYLVQFAPENVEVQFRLNETLFLILKAIVAFAIAFQFPMVVIVLVYVGILTPETLKTHRKIAIVCLFVVGALLTPPDPISLVMMAMPLVLLYELSIWMSYVVVRRKEKRDEEDR